jgi:dTDP-4-amino-4,6-dideoxygalactose transaminase
MEPIFPLVRPDVPKLVSWQNYLDAIYTSNQFSNGGSNWKTLNARLETLFPGRRVVSVGNNTVGQISVLDALQVRGKRVLISNYTFPATLQAVIHAGAIPVIADVDFNSGEMSVENVDAAIREHGEIDLVLYTRIFGQRLDVKPLEIFLQKKGIPLVIDAAAGLPTTPAAYSESIEVFSFHATKAFSVGEGGAIVGPESKIKSIWEACNFGIRDIDSFGEGINSKMDEFTAARSLAMLENFNFVAKRRSDFVIDAYSEIESRKNIQTISNDGTWAWSLFPVRFVDDESLERFATSTRKLGLSGKKYYAPSMSRGYRGSATLLISSELKNSESWTNNTYCLPVYAQYNVSEIKEIKTIIASALKDLV